MYFRVYTYKSKNLYAGLGDILHKYDHFNVLVEIKTVGPYDSMKFATLDYI